MSTVGIKDLKVHLGRYVSRAARGETITVTDRGTPVAMLVPLSADRAAIEALKRTGRIRGQGAKPLGLRVKIKRKTRRDPDLAGAVIDGRNR
ncbi:MAG TPA: type II toxin-antitoxin system prevent-host-death family antitoxin [Terriglobia bacterium]|nr:type II toxin-antitoxin system prevent-host-death family antitoxin [Terriglobia bacterium]